MFKELMTFMDELYAKEECIISLEDLTPSDRALLNGKGALYYEYMYYPEYDFEDEIIKP